MNLISQGNWGDDTKIIDRYIDNLHEEYIRNHDDSVKNSLLEQIQLLQKVRTEIDSNCQVENPVSENALSIIRNLQEYEKVLGKEIENIELTECSSVLAAYGHNAVLHALEEHRKSIRNILDGRRYCEPQISVSGNMLQEERKVCANCIHKYQEHKDLNYDHYEPYRCRISNGRISSDIWNTTCDDFKSKNNQNAKET